MTENNENDIKLKDISNYWWLFGGNGGKTRIRIINLLLNRPYNANQISKILHTSYRNIIHHLKLLEKAKIVYTNNLKYGKLFIISPDFNHNLYSEVIHSSNSQLKSAISIDS
ncbi:MAG: ArsR/SmtB family transcription factor [Candidatus Helarchaeota archaeon]